MTKACSKQRDISLLADAKENKNAMTTSCLIYLMPALVDLVWQNGATKWL